ncbi:DUF1707 domain-containing protein [Dietzia sp. 111N12-1]|uniref:DUF1707 domain-containing protein n=1 Tax=Dietzia sp. 111N12-1 TaxID=1785156 RepID=UPI000805B997|nr:DUF1707 domain-containing protein [Dietzia sp. 111N12-1]OAV76712.1 hypothetical protein AYO52_06485 [Dietzia sp. 111N12-1]
MDDAMREPDRHLPSVRASDAERDATARLLQESFSEGRLTLAEFADRTSRASAARFRSELIELTHDLPIAHHEHDSTPATRPHGAPARRVTGASGPASSLAIMGGVERAGAWTLPSVHTAFALMGGIEIDLRGASLQSHETTIRAFAIMGGIDIYVPDDVRVEVEGIGLMGGFGEESGHWKPDPRPVRQAPPGAPVIRVAGLALMGGIGVRRVPRSED